MKKSLRIYEVRPREDNRRVVLLSDVLAIRSAVLDRIIPLLKPGRIRHNSR